MQTEININLISFSCEVGRVDHVVVSGARSAPTNHNRLYHSSSDRPTARFMIYSYKKEYVAFPSILNQRNKCIRVKEMALPSNRFRAQSHLVTYRKWKFIVAYHHDRTNNVVQNDF